MFFPTKPPFIGDFPLPRLITGLEDWWITDNHQPMGFVDVWTQHG